jgi:hypothetical protein
MKFLRDSDLETAKASDAKAETAVAINEANDYPKTVPDIYPEFGRILGML